jgi:hypothetical protein
MARKGTGNREQGTEPETVTDPVAEISQPDQFEADAEGTGDREQRTEQADSAPSEPISEISQADPFEAEDSTDRDITPDPVESTPTEPQGTYATEYFKANGIPYCDRCGEQFHSDSEGNPVCAESLSDCPRLT